ncbi:MAG TPA: 1-phosphofructokinase [Tepidisphaeraceae bacterium]|jgi:1-phosphofructokinase family hexose kinase
MTLPPIITVTLNPAIDQTLAINGFAAGRVNRVQQSHTHPGGKGVNVAVMLADLGASVVATGWLGNRNAEGFQLLFAQKRIDDQFLRVPGETRVGIKITDESSGQTTDINFPGLRLPPTAGDGLIDHLKTLIRPDQWVVLAGSVPPGIDDDFYGRLIDVVQAQGGRVALDTSGEPLRHALPHGPDLVKPNVEELSALLGRPLATPGDLIEAAREAIIRHGTALAVVSMGGDGALFVEAGRAVRTHPPHVAVKSTVGAGDAMVAGLVYALANGLSLDEAARLSTALSVYAVTRMVSGLETPNGHESYAAQIRLEPA